MPKLFYWKLVLIQISSRQTGRDSQSPLYQPPALPKKKQSSDRSSKDNTFPWLFQGLLLSCPKVVRPPIADQRGSATLKIQMIMLFGCWTEISNRKRKTSGWNPQTNNFECYWSLLCRLGEGRLLHPTNFSIAFDGKPHSSSANAWAFNRIEPLPPQSLKFKPS